MNTLLEQINSAGLTFVKFAASALVQSSVLIVILLALDFMLRKKVRAVFRYCIWMLVLVKLVLPTTLSSPTSLGYWLGDKLSRLDVSNIVVKTDAAGTTQIVKSAPIETTNTAPTVTPPQTIVTPPPTDTEPTVMEPTDSSAVSGPVTPITWQAVVFLVWLAVVSAMAILLLQRAVFVCGLVAQAKSANDLMNDTFDYCRGRVGIKRKVGLKVSANATSPAVCGLFRPVILIPENLAPNLGASGLRVVLMHELAHIKRGDLWVNLVQTILQIIHFYNPLLWLANWVIRRVREQAVDEMVLVTMDEKAKQYSQTLVDVAKLAFKRPALSLRLIGVVESKSALAGRVKRILNRPIPKSAKLGIAGLLAIIVVGAVLLPMAKVKKTQKNLTTLNENSWKTQLAGFWGKRNFVTPDITIFAPVEENGNLIIRAKQHSYAKNMGTETARITVKDHSLRLIAPNLNSIEGMNTTERFITSKFNNIALDQVSEILFQTRPYQWVKTDVQIEVEKASGQGQAKEVQTKKSFEKLRSVTLVINGRDKITFEGKGLKGWEELGLEFMQVPNRKETILKVLVDLEYQKSEDWTRIKHLLAVLTKEYGFDHLEYRSQKEEEKPSLNTVGPQWVASDLPDEVDGFALQFDGIDDCVKVKRSKSLEPESEITVEMWALLDGQQSPSTRLLRKAGHYAPGYILAADQVGDRRIQFRVDLPGDVAFAEDRYVAFVEDRLIHNKYIGQWHHFAGVYSKTHTTLYIDGIEINRVRHDGRGMIHSPVDLYIGHGAPSGPREHFKGLIDDVRIWDIARSAEEIKQTMRQRLHGGEVGLIGYWNFDEGSGKIANDLSLNKNHGRLIESSQRFSEVMPYRFRPMEKGAKFFFQAPIEFKKDISITRNASGEFRQRHYKNKGEWMTDETERHKERASLYVNSIRFEKSLFKRNVSANLKIGYSSWPKALWQITVKLLDDNEHILIEDSSEFETTGNILSGQVLRGSSELDFSFGRWKDISEAATFVVTVTPQQEDVGDSRQHAEEGESEFKATLSNGVTVELVGLTPIPVKEENPWWKPDGTPVKPMFDRVDYYPSEDPNNEQYNYYAAIVRIDGVSREEVYSALMMWHAEGAKYAGSTNAYKGGKIFCDGNLYTGAIGKVSKGIDTTDIHLGLAIGEWQTITSGRHTGFYEVEGDTVIIGEPRRGGGPGGLVPWAKGYAIGLTYTITPATNRDFRVVILDKDGKLHPGEKHGSSGTDKLRQTNRNFPSLDPRSIDKYLIQSRPYEWVTFKNVSLKQNFKTDVQIEVEKPDEMSQIEQTCVEDSSEKLRSVTLVINGRDEITFEGKELKALQEIPFELIQVPERENTVLKVLVESEIKRRDDWKTTKLIFAVWANEYGFDHLEVTEIGVENEVLSAIRTFWNYVDANDSDKVLEVSAAWWIKQFGDSLGSGLEHLRDTRREQLQNHCDITDPQEVHFGEDDALALVRCIPQNTLFYYLQRRGGRWIIMFSHGGPSNVDDPQDLMQQIREKIGTTGALESFLERIEKLQCRNESLSKLSEIGMQLIMYAEDHDGAYPERLDELSTYAREDILEWAKDNVKYLGRGKNAQMDPQVVIAYDQGLLSEQDSEGTNVFYNDGHVEFVKAEQLQKQGILPEQKLDVQVEGQQKRQERALREVNLPDVDESKKMLDLSSGKLLEIPSERGSYEDIDSAIKKFGEGDMIYDGKVGNSAWIDPNNERRGVLVRGLFLARNATIDIPANLKKGPFEGIAIEHLPIEFAVTTKEGWEYKVKIFSADNESCQMQYRPIEKSNVQVEIGKTAKQDYINNKEIENEKSFVVILPNDTRVELLGLLKLIKEDLKAWKPNGELTQIESVPESAIEGREVVAAYRINGQNISFKASTLKNIPEGQAIAKLSTWYVDGSKIWLSEFKGGSSFGDLWLRQIKSGPWKKLFKLPVTGKELKKNEKITKFEKDFGIKRIDMFHALGPDAF